MLVRAELMCHSFISAGRISALSEGSSPFHSDAVRDDCSVNALKCDHESICCVVLQCCGL